MKTRVKRFLACFLSVLMIVSTCGVTAFALDGASITIPEWTYGSEPSEPVIVIPE